MEGCTSVCEGREDYTEEEGRKKSTWKLHDGFWEGGNGSISVVFQFLQIFDLDSWDLGSLSLNSLV